MTNGCAVSISRQKMGKQNQIMGDAVLKGRDIGMFSRSRHKLVPMEELQSILQRLELTKSHNTEHYQQCSNLTSRDSDVEKFNWLRQDDDGDNGLMLAIIHKREDIFTCLLNQVTSYHCLKVQNNLGQTCLHLAVIVNAPVVVKKLVAWGADVTQMDRKGNTPLHIACERGYWECIKALTTPLVYSDISDRSYYVPFTRIPQNSELRNHDGYTCFHLAVLANNVPAMDYLLRKCNADINAIDWRSGDTVLHYAILAGNMDLLRFLLHFRSLDIDIERYDGLNALDLARLNGDADSFNLLKSFGAMDKTKSHKTQASLSDTVNGSIFEDSYKDLKIDGQYISAS